MTVVDLYTIQIIDGRHGETLKPTRLLDAIMAEAEENISDLLPVGFRAEIRRWNDGMTHYERTPSE